MDTSSLSDETAHEAADGVHLAQLAAGERMSIQHFHIEPGAVVPEHSHEHEQAGYIYAGTLVFIVDGEEYTIGPGDSYVVPSEAAHGVENRGDEAVKGVDIFSPPRIDVPWA